MTLDAGTAQMLCDFEVTVRQRAIFAVLARQRIVDRVGQIVTEPPANNGTVMVTFSR